MTKLCECGCGQPTLPAKQTHRRSGHVKGEPVRFLRGHRSPGVRPPRQPLQGLSPTERFWAHVDKTDACWLWRGATSENGYGIFRTYEGRKDKQGHAHYAHRYSWAMHGGEVPEGLFVCHTCDVRNCVRPDHLWIGTAADNNRDMWQKGRGPVQKGLSRNRGEANPHAQFTDETALAALLMYRTGAYTQRSLAKALGVKASAVQSLVERRTWRHLGLLDTRAARPAHAVKGVKHARR